MDTLRVYLLALPGNYFIKIVHAFHFHDDSTEHLSDLNAKISLFLVLNVIDSFVYRDVFNLSRRWRHSKSHHRLVSGRTPHEDRFPLLPGGSISLIRDSSAFSAVTFAYNHVILMALLI